MYEISPSCYATSSLPTLCCNVQGQVILMEFGIVKILGGDTHTSTGAVLGIGNCVDLPQ